MDDLYREQILEHYKHPRNYGELEQATIVQAEHNPLCGDQLTMYFLIEGDIIKDMRFKGKGCAISQAAASMLSEKIVGKNTGYAKNLNQEFVLDVLGIPIGLVRLRCALLALKTVKAGLYGIHMVEDAPDLV